MTGEKPVVFGNGGIGREYNIKKPCLGLEMGGSIGREVVLGGAVFGWDDCSWVFGFRNYFDGLKAVKGYNTIQGQIIIAIYG